MQLKKHRPKKVAMYTYYALIFTVLIFLLYLYVVWFFSTAATNYWHAVWSWFPIALSPLMMCVGVLTVTYLQPVEFNKGGWKEFTTLRAVFTSPLKLSYIEFYWLSPWLIGGLLIATIVKLSVF